MNRKNILKSKKILILISLIILVLFFYPKQSGIWDDSFTAHAKGWYKNMDCTCIGFTAMESGHSESDTQIQLCYGVPIECKYSCKMAINEAWQSVSCDNLRGQ